MRKFFKWLGYSLLVFMSFVILVLALAYYNRDLIFEKTSQALNKSFNGKLMIEKYNFSIIRQFPKITISLENVQLQDSLTATDIFSARKVDLHFGFYPLLQRKVEISSLTIDQAQVYLYRSPEGLRNFDNYKNITDTTAREEGSTFDLDLHEFDLREVKLIYADSLINKSYRFEFVKTHHTLHADSAFYNMRITGDMHFDEIIFNPKAGGFVVNQDAKVDLRLLAYPDAKQITVLPSSLIFNKQKIQIEGEFGWEKNGNYALNFLTEQIYLKDGKALVNSKLNTIFNKYSINKPLDVSVALKGKTTPGYQPDIVVQFGTERAKFGYGKIVLNDLSFSGTFTQPADTSRAASFARSQIDIASFVGEIEDIPFRGNVIFTHLNNPEMNLTMASEINYKRLINMIDTTRFVPKSGTFSTSIHYEGKLDEYLDSTRTRYEGKLQGKITASNGALFYKPKKFNFDKVNAMFEFNEKQFTIKHLAFHLNDSPVRIQGTVKNFIPFFIKPSDKGYVNLDVTSPRLDLTTLFAERNKQNLSKKQTDQQRKKMTDMIDLVYQKLEFDVGVKAKELAFREFKAKNISGTVKLSQDKIESKEIRMDVADGTTSLGFSLSELEKSQSPLVLTSEVTDANIKQFFLYFDNFNQNTLLADNLEGTISAKVKFEALVDEDYSVVAPSMKGSIDSKIKNGALKNFEPLEDVSIFLFRKRDFTDIQFAEINSSFTIDGTALDISRMEIQSSVLTLFVKGRYSFTDTTNLSVQLPLSNLKKRDKNYEPKNIGTEADAGMSVFLHVYRYDDIDSKINIDYDLFRKWAKKIEGQ